MSNLRKERHEIKERPMIFSVLTVQATLENRKKMTRRTVKLPKGARWGKEYDGQVIFDDGSTFGHEMDVDEMRCPYGRIGDRLWVREDYWHDNDGLFYKADQPHDSEWLKVSRHTKALGTMFGWRIAMFMPRTASRILLEITNVRVERLHDITEADAIAEGIERLSNEFNCSPWRNYRIGQAGEMSIHCSCPKRSYMTLWESINGAGSWAKNPWVWVIEFKVLEMKK